MTVCRDCGTQWTGQKAEHCPVCHETFAGARPGDCHRTGDHGVTEGPKRRRCRTPDELRAGGMWTTTQPSGAEVWHGEWSKTGKQHRRNAGAYLRHEQPQTHTQVPPEKSGP